MSYRFEGGEKVSDGVKRIALAQVDKALGQTKATTASLDRSIHDTRVCFKKLRALLRLVRDGLDDKIYERENLYCRDSNRRLSSLRDTAAMAETLKSLREEFAEQLAENAFESLLKSLTRSTRKRQAEKKKALSEIAKTLEALRVRVEKWSIKADGFSAVSQGLKHTYSQGQIAFVTAYREQTVKGFHEWRKQVKYLWYHVRLMRFLWPEPLKQLARELKKLSDYLNNDHDLAMLHQRVLDEPESSTDPTDREALIALITKRRTELQGLARVLGERIYAEQPTAFKKRFRDYWQAWQQKIGAP